MTRHGRNATNSAVYSYHERQRDAAASGFGSEKCRLNKDSLKGFDCCSLTLQPCRDPVRTLLTNMTAVRLFYDSCHELISPYQLLEKSYEKLTDL